MYISLRQMIYPSKCGGQDKGEDVHGSGHVALSPWVGGLINFAGSASTRDDRKSEFVDALRYCSKLCRLGSEPCVFVAVRSCDDRLLVERRFIWLVARRESHQTCQQASYIHHDPLLRLRLRWELVFEMNEEVKRGISEVLEVFVVVLGSVNGGCGWLYRFRDI